MELLPKKIGKTVVYKVDRAVLECEGTKKQGFYLPESKLSRWRSRRAWPLYHHHFDWDIILDRQKVRQARKTVASSARSVVRFI